MCEPNTTAEAHCIKTTLAANPRPEPAEPRSPKSPFSSHIRTQPRSNSVDEPERTHGTASPATSLARSCYPSKTQDRTSSPTKPNPRRCRLSRRERPRHRSRQLLLFLVKRREVVFEQPNLSLRSANPHGMVRHFLNMQPQPSQPFRWNVNRDSVVVGPNRSINRHITPPENKHPTAARSAAELH